MRLLSQIMERVRSGKHRDEPAKFAVRCDSNGLMQLNQRGSAEQLAWNQVSEVYAFKRDLFTIDQICLLIGSHELDRWIQVNEDDEGFDALIKEIPLYLSGCPSAAEWWKCVATPPFETQWTQLWTRPKETTIDTTERDEKP